MGDLTPILESLFKAIAARDRPEAARLIADSPEVARIAIGAGATRAQAKAHFFAGIGHYAYAGDTALHFAAAAYAADIASALLALGAGVRARNRMGAEPLHYAADGSPNSAAWDPDAQRSVIALLVGAGADPNSVDKNGVAPLHRAVRTRCSSAVDALLAHGADALKPNGSGSTPLHLAVQNTGRSASGTAAAHHEQTRIIRRLLEHGAQPSDRDSSGKSVRDCVKAAWIEALLDAS